MQIDNEDNPHVGLEDEALFETSLSPHELSHLPAAEIIESSDEASGSSIIRKPNWIGKKFSRFKLLRLLGEGSMGRVILAEDVNLHRVIALKVLRKRIKGMDGDQAIEQFLREARSAAKIDHPNVVKIYEINEYDGWWYIAMELVEGQTLQQVVKATAPLSPARACVIIGDAATALEVAHEQGIIHRDVKPSNLMITRQGRCKLTDFGLVRADSPDDPFELHDKSVGTPKFMAPEVVQHKQQGTALDIYSLGATFFYALTGRPPYTAEKVALILKQHVDAPPPDLKAILPGCSQSMADLLKKMMAKNPEERPSAGAVAAALSSEAIAFRDDDSGWSGTVHSGLGQGASITSGGSTVNLPGGIDDVEESSHTGRRTGPRIVFALIAIAGIAILLWSVFLQPASTNTFDPKKLSELFPGTPDSYGELPPGKLPEPLDPLRHPPASSWRGKVDTTNFLFVAARQGRFYYPIDHPQAALITVNQLEGFITEEDARKSGRLLAD